MESRKVAALLASVVSQLIILVQLLFPSHTLLSLPSNSNSPPEFQFHQTTFSIISHFLSSHDIVALLSLHRKKRRRLNPQSELDDDRVKLGMTRSPDSFRNSFKMSASTFEWLSGLLEPLLDCRDPVGSPLNLSAELRLGVGLFRLANGAEYAEIAKRFDVSESAARFCAKQLCRVLCTNFRFWVGFPGGNELECISNEFEGLTGLPNACGFVACTRFKIGKDGEDSVAAQIVVDSSSRILSVVAGFSGDKSDWNVLKSSSLYKDVEEGRLLGCEETVTVDGVDVGQYFVGDGGYPLLPWLMMPFRDAMPGSNEANFNKAVNLTRVPALRTISSLRNWGVLSTSMQEDLRTAVAYIGACAILHNALLMREDFSALCDDVGDFSLHQSSQFKRNESSDDALVRRKAAVIRSVLATRARRL